MDEKYGFEKVGEVPETVESTSKKTPLYYSSRFWITLFAFITVGIMALQFVLDLIPRTDIQLKGLWRFLNFNLIFPMKEVSWFWAAVISLACGFDRTVDIINTKNLPKGEMDMGDLAKLRFIILETLVLFIIALGFNLFSDADFQLLGFFTAFASSTILYTSGNKLVKATKHQGEKVENTETESEGHYSGGHGHGHYRPGRDGRFSESRVSEESEEV